jgi:hypothetical protein
MSNLNVIRKEIADLEALAALSPQEIPKSGIEPAPEPDIADDDPELLKYLSHPDSEVAKLLPRFTATTIPEAKRAMARDLHQKRLLGTAGDEKLPIQQRIEAAVAWRALRPAGNRWATLSDSDLVEALSTHPHLPRLQELAAIVYDPVLPKEVGWQTYLQNQWAALSEFHALRHKYQLRDAPVVISLEAVAGRVIKNSPAILNDFSARQEVYAFAKELARTALKLC